MKVNTNVIFSIIWAIFCILFLIMGYQSYMSVNTKLPRYSFEPAAGNSISLGNGANIGDAIKTLNETVAKLEESIVSEAKTMTAINFISAFLCLLGLYAQKKSPAVGGENNVLNF
ncbi:MAG: hypothetical protein ABII09_12685 [Planctomycetota bacterium]